VTWRQPRWALTRRGSPIETGGMMPPPTLVPWQPTAAAAPVRYVINEGQGCCSCSSSTSSRLAQREEEHSSELRSKQRTHTVQGGTTLYKDAVFPSQAPLRTESRPDMSAPFLPHRAATPHASQTFSIARMGSTPDNPVSRQA
jgi:hypothetical protein